MTRESNTRTRADWESDIKRVAEQAAADVVATTTAAAVNLSTTAAAAAHELASKTSVDLQYIKNDLSEIKTRLDSKYVTNEAFAPIKQLVYGLVGVILIAVVGGLLSLVLKK